VVVMNEVCDAGQIAEEVISPLSSARVTVTLEIWSPGEVVRIVSENSRALKYGVRGGMRPARRRW